MGLDTCPFKIDLWTQCQFHGQVPLSNSGALLGGCKWVLEGSQQMVRNCVIVLKLRCFSLLPMIYIQLSICAIVAASSFCREFFLLSDFNNSKIWIPYHDITKSKSSQFPKFPKLGLSFRIFHQLKIFPSNAMMEGRRKCFAITDIFNPGHPPPLHRLKLKTKLGGRVAGGETTFGLKWRTEFKGGLSAE